MSEEIFKSETDKLRKYLEPYCIGDGVDVGAGGSKIKDSAISIDLPENERYANVGDHPIQLQGNGRYLHWFRNNVLDYCYSSHFIEDVQDTIGIMKEFTRILKLGGYLVLNLPHEMKYREVCDRTGQPYNQHHTIKDMSAEYIKECAKQIPELEFVYETGILYEYCFGIVFKKIK